MVNSIRVIFDCIFVACFNPINMIFFWNIQPAVKFKAIDCLIHSFKTIQLHVYEAETERIAGLTRINFN